MACHVFPDVPAGRIVDVTKKAKHPITSILFLFSSLIVIPFILLFKLV